MEAEAEAQLGDHLQMTSTTGEEIGVTHFTDKLCESDNDRRAGQKIRNSRGRHMKVVP